MVDGSGAPSVVRTLGPTKPTSNRTTMNPSDASVSVWDQPNATGTVIVNTTSISAIRNQPAPCQIHQRPSARHT